MLSVLNSTQLNNVNPSTRALIFIWSTALDGRRPINNQARKGRNTILCHGPQPRAPFATCKCMRPTQLGLGLQSGETIRKKKKLTHCSTTLRKNGCISSHGDTQRNEKPLLNSAPEQAERPETHHRLPTPHSIPLAILEMMLPSHAIVKKKPWKKHQPKSIRESPR